MRTPPPWLPDAVTLASLLLGTGAIVLAATAAPHDHSAIAHAGAAIVLAGIADAVDGRVARWIGGDRPHGALLDALADFVSFGVAPAVVAWSWGLSALGLAGLALAAAWVFASGFRLTRFVRTPSGPGLHGTGLATTMAGGTLGAWAWAAVGPTSPAVLGAAMGLGAAAMASRIPYRTFRSLRADPIARCALGVAVPCAVVTWATTSGPTALALVGTGYATLGALDGWITRGRQGPSASDELAAA